MPIQDGNVAVVTGESKGNGAEIARRLAASGEAVVVKYSSSKSDANQVASDITATAGKAVAVQTNVANHTDIRHMIDMRRQIESERPTWPDWLTQ